MKRIFAVCLCVCLCLSVICVPAFAAETSGSCGSGVNWSYDAATGVLALSGSGAIDDYASVTSIPWKEYCPSVKSVTIGEGITRIGDNALSWLEQVPSITLPSSVEEIGEKAFGWCTGLQSITLSSALRKIEDEAFSCDSALISVTLPASATEVASTAFYQTSALQSINAEDGNAVYKSFDGVLYDITKASLVAYPAGKADTTFTLPDNIVEIEESAFYNAENLTSVALGDVDTIGRKAFSGCENLYDVSLSSANSIGDLAFYGCRSMVKFVFPESVTSVGDKAFSYCENLRLAIFLGGSTLIGEKAFAGDNYVAIVADYGSVYHTYAQGNGYPFYYIATVVYNGEEVYYDPSAFVVNDATTMVPMRTVFEMLGAEVTWDETTNSATAAKDGTSVTVQIGSDALVRNGEVITLPETTKLIADKTYVPLRAVSEAFGNTVEWINETNTVNIY